MSPTVTHGHPGGREKMGWGSRLTDPISIIIPPVAMHTAIILVLSVIAVFVIQRFLDVRRVIRTITHSRSSGHRFFALSPASFLSRRVPHIPGIAKGRNALMRLKHREFQEVGWDGFMVVSAWPRAEAALTLADASTIKEVTSSRARFPKPVHRYKFLQLFGGNIVASEGDEWKRYRKIAAPAFSERNNKLVWDETVLIMEDLFKNVWHDESVTLDHALDITLPIALFVIGVAGFGRRVSWQDDVGIPAGHQMAFKEALHEVSTHIILKVVVPEWALGLRKSWRKVALAFKELNQYMLEMVQARRTAEKKDERYDLFSSLMDASEGDHGEALLKDSDLTGNIFIFLLAGHETTGHTLCFTLGYLALYPDVQERLYQEISRVSGPGSMPTYEDMNQLSWAMAVFYETLRLLPPVVAIPKESAEDTTLTVGNLQEEKATIVVPKDTQIVLHVYALHHNPRYWEDPLSFKPERFLGDWPRDAFIPFSAGPRACIGRKFFETEAIAIMCAIISKYKVEVKEEPEFANETFEERRARVLGSKSGLTTTPIRVPLAFKRR
ncbi:cytochrome P450 [Auriscalpium vulgare]|uniref:Cytochrome P450 n=1 Tax=Auriscalpium vulgare TaxID=40419 RepID=A0ACB8RYC4_9AGAM|nr:cytochrome P450 [Auriscalpium vulgare]